ncbi:hypothetical protein KSP35_05870 [Aquihabitans sp. G128]|uniref:hypothetical protein n=1 Tax=Aquihabitans sp. G128 TaxID=2849779 RepID=UPI001C214607|nr:hypothetical protein [Aquihabitans sp. G128]QXC62332.1 hypothetical protein KSP35_05870 [Aquihabitans sp. G128]
MSTGSTASEGPEAALEAELWRQAERGNRRWAWQAAVGIGGVLPALLVGGTTLATSGGGGLGGRPGGFLAWLGVVASLGALLSVRADVELVRRPTAPTIVLLGSIAIAVALRSAVAADLATPWPLVGLLGACWAFGTAGTELLRLRSVLAIRPEELPTSREVWALRRRARDTTASHRSAPET